MTLPLRIELAMTFKAVFPNIWPPTNPDMGVLRPLRARGLDGRGVVFGKRRRDRECLRFEVVYAPPILDPWGGLVFALGVEGEADHHVTDVRPMLSQPRVIVLQPLDQVRLHMIERIPVFRVAMQLFGNRLAEEIVPGQVAQRL